jgi:uncharacterized phiE125 gp8 family phage protein
MGLKLITPPNVEPVTLDEARAHVRAAHNADDGLLANLITAARIYCENALARQFVTATWRWTLDRFYDVQRAPMGLYNEWVWNPMRTLRGRTVRDWYCLFVPRAPVQKIVSLKYYDSAGVERTWDPVNYIIDTDSEPARITPGWGQFWPPWQLRENAVTITFKAGYGEKVGDDDPTDEASVAAVPQTIKQAILLLVGHWYENREAVVIGPAPTSIPMAVDALLGISAWGSYVNC